jgi:hypothetical protein
MLPLFVLVHADFGSKEGIAASITDRTEIFSPQMHAVMSVVDHVYVLCMKCNEFNKSVLSLWPAAFQHKATVSRL